MKNAFRIEPRRHGTQILCSLMLVWQTGLPDLHGQETPPKAIATTSADRQVSGWIEGRSPRDLHFHTSAQAVSLKQIHRVLWDVGTLRLPEPPARRVLLSGGEALIAPCLGATESSLRLHWPGDREFELPLSGVEAIANPPGGTPLYYEDFEHLPIAWRCADDAKPVLDRAHSTSGERSLRWPEQACVLERVPEALSAGKVEFHFYDPGEVVAGVRCVCQFTFETRLGQQRLRAVLGADSPRYSLETPDHSALTRQELRRRPGWHRLSLEWDAERTLALIDRDVLASGPALAGVLQAVSLNRSLAGNANDNADAPLWIDDFSIQKPGVYLPLPTNSRELDVAVLMSGDEIFGDWLGSTQRDFSLRTPFGEWTTPWSKLRGVVLRTRPSAGKPIQGWICRVEFPSTSPVAPVDQLVAALQSADAQRLTLQHPLLGEFEIATSAIRKLEPLFAGELRVLETAPVHLGDEVRDDFRASLPVGTQHALKFELSQVPHRPTYVSCDVDQIEPCGPHTILGSPFLAELRAGGLLTQVFVNDQLIGDLNHLVSHRPPTARPERVRLEIPLQVLRAGTNTLRFEQLPSRADPHDFDDAELSRVALEISDEAP